MITLFRSPLAVGARFSPPLNLRGLSSDCLRRLLARSDCPWWGVAPLRCRRPSEAVRLFRSWQLSLDRCYPASWRTLRFGYCGRDRYLIRLFSCQRTLAPPELNYHRVRRGRESKKSSSSGSRRERLIRAIG